jgi:hypothetical protein
MWAGTGDRWVRNPHGDREHYVLPTAGWQGMIAALEIYREKLKNVQVMGIVNAYRAPGGIEPKLRFT